jgi:hypothetical protein
MMTTRGLTREAALVVLAAGGWLIPMSAMSAMSAGCKKPAPAVETPTASASIDPLVTAPPPHRAIWDVDAGSTQPQPRPELHPSADDAFAAFAAAGFGVPSPQLSLGETYKSPYCAHGITTAKDVSVMVCEYADESRAELGLAEAKGLFTKLATRTAVVHKSLLLVTIPLHKGNPGGTAAEQAKIAAAFDAL